MMEMKPRHRVRASLRWMLTILAVGLVVIWIGSGWYNMSYSTISKRNTSFADIECWIHGGEVVVLLPKGNIDIEALPTGAWTFLSKDKFGLRVWAWRWHMSRNSKSVHFPLWLPPFLLAIPTALLWRAHIRTRHRKPDTCFTCGYDITGLASKHACPECGTAINAEISKTSAS